MSRFGIFGTIGIEKTERKFPLFTYRILRKHASSFLEKIGTDFPNKMSALKGIVKYNNRENVHSTREDIDIIPGIGGSISRAAKPLKLPGYSRTYKRYEKKDYVGKETLSKYVTLFDENNASGEDMDILRVAINSDIVWGLHHIHRD